MSRSAPAAASTRPLGVSGFPRASGSTKARAPPGFLENVEITALWPPRTPALPPPSNVGNGATSKSGARLFFLPTEYAYGQLRWKVARPASKVRRGSSPLLGGGGLGG